MSGNNMSGYSHRLFLLTINVLALATVYGFDGELLFITRIDDDGMIVLETTKICDYLKYNKSGESEPEGSSQCKPDMSVSGGQMKIRADSFCKCAGYNVEPTISIKQISNDKEMNTNVSKPKNSSSNEVQDLISTKQGTDLGANNTRDTKEVIIEKDNNNLNTSEILIESNHGSVKASNLNETESQKHDSVNETSYRNDSGKSLPDTENLSEAENRQNTLNNNTKTHENLVTTDKQKLDSVVNKPQDMANSTNFTESQIQTDKNSSVNNNTSTHVKNITDNNIGMFLNSEKNMTDLELNRDDRKTDKLENDSFIKDDSGNATFNAEIIETKTNNITQINNNLESGEKQEADSERNISSDQINPGSSTGTQVRVENNTILETNANATDNTGINTQALLNSVPEPEKNSTDDPKNSLTSNNDNQTISSNNTSNSPSNVENIKMILHNNTNTHEYLVVADNKKNDSEENKPNDTIAQANLNEIQVQKNATYNSTSNVDNVVLTLQNNTKTHEHLVVEYKQKNASEDKKLDDEITQANLSAIQIQGQNNSSHERNSNKTVNTTSLTNNTENTIKNKSVLENKRIEEQNKTLSENRTISKNDSVNSTSNTKDNETKTLENSTPEHKQKPDSEVEKPNNKINPTNLTEIHDQVENKSSSERNSIKTNVIQASVKNETDDILNKLEKPKAATSLRNESHENISEFENVPEEISKNKKTHENIISTDRQKLESDLNSTENPNITKAAITRDTNTHVVILIVMALLAVILALLLLLNYIYYKRNRRGTYVLTSGGENEMVPIH